MANKSSWIRRQQTDPYVKAAAQKGYRSRAAFKLLEIHQKDKLFRKGMCVVDLGAAPGGWSQVAAELVGTNGKIIAVDLLEMKPITGVRFIRGDFTDPEIIEQIHVLLNHDPVDLVICDMAPNMSGIAVRDQARAMELVSLAADFSIHVLKQNAPSRFVVKVFQGDGFEELLKQLRISFKFVKIRKPKASRDESREMYMVCSNHSK